MATSSRTTYSGEYENGGPSGLVWAKINTDLILTDRNYGIRMVDDFLPFNSSLYTATPATAGAAAAIAGEGGICEIDSGSTTSTQGLNLQDKVASLRIPDTLPLAFEAKLNLSANATGPNFFIGLAITDTSLIASSVLTSACVGFQSLTANNVLLGVSKDAAGATVTESLGSLPTDGSDIYLGFRIEKGMLRFYVTRAEVGPVVRTNLPTGLDLARTVVCQTRGTTRPVVNLDWWDVAAAKLSV